MEDKQVRVTAKTRQALTLEVVVKTMDLDKQGWKVVGALRGEYFDWLGRKRWQALLQCKKKAAKHE